jgi:hypothetical protein
MTCYISVVVCLCCSLALHDVVCAVPRVEWEVRIPATVGPKWAYDVVRSLTKRALDETEVTSQWDSAEVVFANPWFSALTDRQQSTLRSLEDICLQLCKNFRIH